MNMVVVGLALICLFVPSLAIILMTDKAISKNEKIPKHWDKLHLNYEMRVLNEYANVKESERRLLEVMRRLDEESESDGSGKEV